MIPKNITAEDVRRAIQRIRSEGYPAKRASTRFDLLFEGELFPPKVVISYANAFANGTRIGARSPRPPLFDRMSTYRTLRKRSLNFLCPDVNGDGTIAVGMAGSVVGTAGALVWTKGVGVSMMASRGPGVSVLVAHGISADGSTIVGESETAFRWTSGGGLEDLGALPGELQLAVSKAASRDGSVVVGYSFVGFGENAGQIGFMGSAAAFRRGKH